MESSNSERAPLRVSRNRLFDQAMRGAVGSEDRGSYPGSYPSNNTRPPLNSQRAHGSYPTDNPRPPRQWLVPPHQRHRAQAPGTTQPYMENNNPYPGARPRVRGVNLPLAKRTFQSRIFERSHNDAAPIARYYFFFYT